MKNLQAITKHFTTEGTVLTAFPYGSGHINDTYKVETTEPGCHNYILQRINHKIFKNVPGLMDNIDRVTRHIRMKLENTPGADPDRQGLTLIPTLDNKSFFQDPDGNYWRMYIFIEDNRSYDIVDTPEKAFEGGRMFGKFQSMIADLPGDPLHETIPDFHNIDIRLETLRKTIEIDPVGRASMVTAEVGFVWERAEEMVTILHLGQKGLIPQRITHNDTKFNNVLLDKNDKGLCVIDLDTVMPGYVHYDYGDSIRTSTNTGAEDDPDLSKVELDIRLFEAYTKGFLQETRSTLTPTELEHLPLAGKLFPYIIGVRFLTDYIDGDNYFKIKHEHHNLQRARAQFKLLTSMERQFGEMEAVVKRYRG
ncbi:MAG: aminoglycoside phosphotransferase family protein [Porphyromonadaceae bacterium]|nr:MAG: aminoglycoside phosphotransferase family protein [Porphyromonadaceae bacterium]